MGRTPGDLTGDVDLFEPGAVPRLIHSHLGADVLERPVPAGPRSPPSEPMGGSELLALDSDGQQIWAVGGGATSGPAAPDGGIVAPAAGGPDRRHAWREVAFPVVDAAVPTRPVRRRGGGPRDVDRLGAVETFGERGSPGAHAKVAPLQPDGDEPRSSPCPPAGPGRGSAAKIAFTGPNEGWMVTATGWLFHYTDGTAYPRNPDPAYQGTITFRPNEAAEQFLPDTPPVDDSELFKPPPVELEQARRPGRREAAAGAAAPDQDAGCAGRTLIVRFFLARKARVQLIARRKGRTVARTRARTLSTGPPRPAPAARSRSAGRSASASACASPVSLQTEAPADGDTVPTGGDGDTIATGAGR